MEKNCVETAAFGLKTFINIYNYFFKHESEVNKFLTVVRFDCSLT